MAGGRVRRAFAKALADIADSDSRVVLITADLGYDVLDEFRSRHPDKFINVGPAEQAMIGVAVGMAKEGFVPYAYSIGTFAIFRPFEFIRNGVVHHSLPVRIVGVGRGREYGNAGSTHWPEEDADVCRRIGLAVIEPWDAEDTIATLHVFHEDPAPFYLRLTK